MAENQEDRSREDLTEEASPYRLEEYRRKGIVAQSKEVSALLALVACGAVAYGLGPKMGSDLMEFMRDVFRTDLSSRADLHGTHVLSDVLSRALRITAAIGLPVCLAGFVLGVLGSVAQIGSVFSLDPITPDLSKLDPIKGLQRVFSLRQITDGIRLGLKTLVILFAAIALVKTEVLKSPAYLDGEPSTLIVSYGQVGKAVFLSLCLVLAVFAVIDYVVQRWEFSKSVRMTKQEAKQEFKEREGDPQIKARIRAVQREIARRRMMAAVKKADVVVTNPTHIAVALVYDKEKMSAPKVVAKGADFLAQKIKKAASDAGIPLVENVPLARALFKSVKIGHSIPRALYQAVAEVLAHVYRLKGRRS